MGRGRSTRATRHERVRDVCTAHGARERSSCHGKRQQAAPGTARALHLPERRALFLVKLIWSVLLAQRDNLGRREAFLESDSMRLEHLVGGGRPGRHRYNPKTASVSARERERSRPRKKAGVEEMTPPMFRYNTIPIQYPVPIPVPEAVRYQVPGTRYQKVI